MGSGHVAAKKNRSTLAEKSRLQTPLRFAGIRLSLQLYSPQNLKKKNNVANVLLGLT